MDSVITQVKKEEGPPLPEEGGDENAEPGTQNGVNNETTSGDSGSGSGAPVVSLPEKGSKKKHKLFQSLMCCFGIRRRSKFPGPSTDSKGCTIFSQNVLGSNLLLSSGTEQHCSSGRR